MRDLREAISRNGVALGDGAHVALATHLKKTPYGGFAKRDREAYRDARRMVDLAKVAIMPAHARARRNSAKRGEGRVPLEAHKTPATLLGFRESATVLETPASQHARHANFTIDPATGRITGFTDLGALPELVSLSWTAGFASLGYDGLVFHHAAHAWFVTALSCYQRLEAKETLDAAAMGLGVRKQLVRQGIPNTEIQFRTPSALHTRFSIELEPATITAAPVDGFTFVGQILIRETPRFVDQLNCGGAPL